MDFQRGPVERYCPTIPLYQVKSFPVGVATQSPLVANAQQYSRLPLEQEVRFIEKEPTFQEENIFHSLKQQPMQLHYDFFGNTNVVRLHAELTKRVKEQTGYTIDRQSDETLSIIMRYIFDENAQYQPNDVPGQVAALNELVLATIVPMAITRIKMHLAYLKDITTLPEPLARAVNTSIIGTTGTEMKRYI